jgi:hypothetical protein
MKRKEAANLGLVTYKTSNPCTRGHNSERYTKGGGCVECVGLLRGKTIDRRNRSLLNNVLAEEAKAKGLLCYIPENPCKAGHKLRFVNSNNCVDCDKMQAEKHKVSKQFTRIKKIYGLTKETYLQMVAVQKSACKLCGNKVENHFNLHIDHCHKTNIVRGLLCGKCNQGIGLLNHSPELLRKAAGYCE